MFHQEASVETIKLILSSSNDKNTRTLNLKFRYFFQNEQ